MPTSFIDEVADLGYLERHGLADDALQRMAALHTGVTEAGAVAERAEVREPILNHCLPAGPDAISPAAWERRAGYGFSGKPTEGRDGLRLTLAACGHDHLPNVLLTAEKV
jgi:ribonuclease BN (tRNA processing enzyme)